MSWETPVPIFEDEDEDQLVNEFVRLSALFPHRDIYEITTHIFKNLREPTRALQAATIWSRDIEILDRIETVKREGFNKEPIDTREVKLRKLEAIYNDPDTPVKNKIDAMKLHAEIQGEIKKATEGEDVNKPRTVVLNYMLDPRAAHAA